jgi:hypothetical protein
VEAHNDEVGGNDDSKEVEESDAPIIGGIECIVGVSTDFFILFVSSDAVIVLDNVKFDEILFETDVCDKSVGSCTCCSGEADDEADENSLPTRHAPPGRHRTCPTCPCFWFCID